MNRIFAPILLLVFLFPSLALSEEVTIDDLEYSFGVSDEAGFFSKKFSEVPFTGKVTGRYQGKIKNGKRDGPWVSYHDDGTVVKFLTGTYKDGKKVK